MTRKLTTDLSELPFDALLKAQASIRPPRQKRKEQPASSTDKASASERKSVERAKSSKSAPAELSSKYPVGRGREVVEVKTIERRDPRFSLVDDRPTDKTTTKQRYQFLETYREDEMRLLKESIKKAKDPDAKAELEKTLKRLVSRQRAVRDNERREQVIGEFKRKEREAVKSGKKPFYLKASEQQTMVLKNKFDEIKDTKNIDTYMEKRRKRRSQKDKKRTLPSL